MNKCRIILLSLPVLLMVTVMSCRPHYNDQLEEIESVMKINSDSAMGLLSEFELHNDTSSLSRPNYHLYQLLRAQSRYFSDVADIVNPALEAAAKFFEEKKDLKRASASEFLLGNLHISAGKNIQ